MIKGKVFAIEEFSTFDGPGIRETIFLKGCPLCCQWCHNPEGQLFETEVLRSPNGCLACEKCLEEGEQRTGRRVLVKESIFVCPRNLVRLCGDDYTPQKLVERISKNVALLNASGGGVTFSGGEPLAQAEFLLECLKLMKDKTNRAIQTSGFSTAKVFETILGHCDYVLYDLKHMDDAVHRHYTGVSNQQILENYVTLARSKVKFITRIPLIPGVNDTEENIMKTARFMSEHGVNKVELLPYNKYAGSKYKLAGREYRPDFDEALEPNPQTKIFHTYGVEVKIL